MTGSRESEYKNYIFAVRDAVYWCTHVATYARFERSVCYSLQGTELLALIRPYRTEGGKDVIPETQYVNWSFSGSTTSIIECFGVSIDLFPFISVLVAVTELVFE
jgi:hypothetical protein